MYFLTITLYLISGFAPQITTFYSRDPNVDLSPFPIKIKCADDLEIVFEYDVWSKFDYFIKILKNCDLNISGAEYIEERDFNSNILEKIRLITLSKDTDSFEIDDFIEIIFAIEKFIIGGEYRAGIYKRLVNIGTKCDNIDYLLNKYIESCIYNNESLLSNVFIRFWHFFLQEIVKRFDLCVKIDKQAIELNNNTSTNIFKYDFLEIEKINKFRLCLSIFNSKTVTDNYDYFIKILDILIHGLIGEKYRNNQIETLTVKGKSNADQFQRLNSIFSNENYTISKLEIKDLYIDFKSSWSQANFHIKKFIYKFPDLETLSLHISYDLEDDLFVDFLKSQIILKKLSILHFHNINISDKIAAHIANLKNLKSLRLPNCSLSKHALDCILNSKILQNSLTELSLYGIKNIYRDHSQAIAKFRNLEKLNLGFCNLYNNVLENILKSNSIQKSVNCLILSHNDRLSIANARLFDNFDVLDNLDVSGYLISLESLSLIFSSEKLKKITNSILYDYTFLPKTLFRELLMFNSLKNLFLNLRGITNDLLAEILNKGEWHDTLNELELTGMKNEHLEVLKSIGNFKSLEKIGIVFPIDVQFSRAKNVLMSLTCKNKIKELTLKGLRFEADDDIALFSELKNLESLDFSYSKFDASVLSKILRLRNLHKSIKRLTLKIIKNFKSEYAENIAMFEELEMLDLRISKISLNDIKVLLESKLLQKSIVDFKFMLPEVSDISRLEGLDIIFMNFEMLENILLYSKSITLEWLKILLKNVNLVNSIKRIDVKITDYDNQNGYIPQFDEFFRRYNIKFNLY